MAMVVALSRRRWQFGWPSYVLRWPVYLLLVWLSWELRFPVTLLVGHQLVGQYWTAENGPLYSLSLSLIILIGDSLLCQSMSLIKLAARWRAEEGIPDKSRRWLAEGLLALVVLLVPRHRRRRAFIRVARWFMRLEARRRTIYHVALFAAEFGVAVVVVYYALVVRAMPSPSPTLHHYQWTYDVVHVLLSAVFGRSALLYLIQGAGERSKGWMSRRREFLYIGVMMCLIGYVALSWYAPEPLRFITGWKIYMGPLAQDVQSRLFTYGPMAPWP